MAAAIGLITIGGLLVASALKGVGITDLIAGAVGGTLNPAGGHKTYAAETAIDVDAAGGLGAALTGSPKSIIDGVVLPIARSHGIHRTAAENDAANHRHGPTISGSRSDHQGPPEKAWAADMSNGHAPTPEMDALARDLADKFDIPWKGSGLAEKHADGYRYQVIYRTTIGGNHFDHVHFGVRREN